MIYNVKEVTISVFRLETGDNETVIEEKLKVSIEKDGLYFNQLSNADIDVRCNLYLGDGNCNIRINNSSVICNKIYFNSQNIVIEAKKPLVTLLVSRESAEYGNAGYPKFEVRLEDDNDLKISFPNIINYHKLRAYSYEFEDDDSSDAKRYIHVIKKIANALRKHGKDTLARDKEFIDFTIVGDDKFRRSVLEFLLSESVLYIDAKEDHLYKLDMGKLGEIGVNWGSLTQENAEMLELGYRKYTEWKDKN